ncbi:MAG: hypothetical protein V7695_02920 [Sulfitobacter sp.]
MIFGTIQIRTLGIAALALGVLFSLFPRPDPDEQRSDLTPVLLEVLEHCIDAAILSKPLSGDKRAAELVAEFDGLLKLAGDNLMFGIEDNFGCWGEVLKQSYDPRQLRERLEAFQASGFNGRVNFCSWRTAHQDVPSSSLVCSFKSASKPENHFRVTVGIVGSMGAFFEVKPTLIFRTDGFARIVN